MSFDKMSVSYRAVVAKENKRA